MLNVGSLAPVSRRSCAILLAMLCGCAGATDADDEASDVLGQQSAPALDALVPVVLADGGADAGRPQNVILLQDEGGADLARVTARGAGCPLGSWSAELAGDDLTFALTFRALGIEIAPTQELATSSCTLTIAPRPSTGRQFTARAIAYTAAARLDQGLTAALEVRHYYEGARANTAHGHVSKEGPYEGPLTLTREIPVGEARWTPCDARGLGVNVDLLLRLSNTFPRVTGTLRGAPEAKLMIALSERSCPEARRDAGVAR
jgi:hypothetical protein